MQRGKAFGAGVCCVDAGMMSAGAEGNPRVTPICGMWRLSRIRRWRLKAERLSGGVLKEAMAEWFDALQVQLRITGFPWWRFQRSFREVGTLHQVGSVNGAGADELPHRSAGRTARDDDGTSRDPMQALHSGLLDVKGQRDPHVAVEVL